MKFWRLLVPVVFSWMLAVVYWVLAHPGFGSADFCLDVKLRLKIVDGGRLVWCLSYDV